MKKILICDDHSIIRRGLKFILTSHFNNYSIQEVHSIKDSMEYLNKNKCDFAILDLQLSDGNMIDSLPNIIALHPKLKILIFSMSNEDIYGKRLLQLGAKGFLNKNADEEEVIRAISIFLSGENYISQRLNNLFIDELRGNSNANIENPFLGLSIREVEVTQQLLYGKGVKEISGLMNLHSNTIMTYKNRIFEKLFVKNLMELANKAKVYGFE
jgi:two-component system, NarL family, invasion response regulator UvrY